ncbi:MAG: hypothetical protein AAF409_16560 [Pseudomonadota bacterium]
MLPPGPVRCILLDGGQIDRSVLARATADARHDLDVLDAASIDQARAFASAGQGDLIILDGGDDAAALATMKILANDALLRAIPVVCIGPEMGSETIVDVMRAGVADCVASDVLSADALDQAVETALRRARGTESDLQAMVSNLQFENEALRRIAARNMRLLKAETVPLLSIAWRFAGGETLAESDRTRVAKGLSRVTRNVTGLIDDTVITAATHRANDVDGPVPLNEVIDRVLNEDLGEIAASRAHVVIGDLPVLRGRRAHFEMLFEELLLTAVRHGRMGQVPEIEIAAARDTQDNPIITFTERGIHLSARKQGLAQRGHDLSTRNMQLGPDPHAWSLCQRLVEKSNGRFRIARSDGQCTRLMMRFPAKQLVSGNAMPTTRDAG